MALERPGRVWQGCIVDSIENEARDAALAGWGVVVTDDRTFSTFDRFAKKWTIYEVSPSGPRLLQA